MVRGAVTSFECELDVQSADTSELSILPRFPM